MIRLWGVQLAAYDRMAADAPLLALLRDGENSIAEEPPQDDPGPYIVLGEGTGVPDDLMVETGAAQTLTMYIWHRDAPLQLVKQILQRLSEIFTDAPLIVDGKPVVSCTVEMAEAGREEIFNRGIFRIRIQTFDQQ